MIPKIIHYCWLSDDPIPTDLERCMKTWKEHLPDYEFIKWDFTRFDKESSQWVKEAFKAKKYAFAADYIRLYALYNFGGIYLDMDVEVLRSYDEFLQLDTMLCYENSDKGKLEVAAFGASKGSKWVKQCLEYYKNRAFEKTDGTYDMKVLPYVIRDCLHDAKYNLINVSKIKDALSIEEGSIPVFPYEFFSPKSYETGEIERTANTYSIHHFAGSWVSKSEKFHLILWRLMPNFVKRIIKGWKKK